MKIAVVFPSVMYREGPEHVGRLLQGFEAIGFHEIDVFDHVVMGYPTEHRPAPFYTPQMPIVEAFMLLSFAAAYTQRATLGTSVLVLPQREPTLVAKQVSTLDTLSAGRVRLGVGSGWQRSEYEAQGEEFDNRGARLDECIEILRSYWRDEHVNYQGAHYQIDEMAMEPKPPQGEHIPIWIGGTKDPALRRTARLGDGWMAMHAPGDPPLEQQLGKLTQYAEQYDRDPTQIGLQMSLSPGPLDKEKRKRFYADPALLLDRVGELKSLGFQQTSIDCVPIFQKGYRTVDAILDYLHEVYQKLAPELDPPLELTHKENTA